MPRRKSISEPCDPPPVPNLQDRRACPPRLHAEIDARQCTYETAVRWAAQNMDSSRVDWQSCPGTLAMSMIKFAWEERKEFLKNVLAPIASPARGAASDPGTRQDDPYESDISRFEKFLLSILESEEMAQAQYLERIAAGDNPFQVLRRKNLGLGEE